MAINDLTIKDAIKNPKLAKENYDLVAKIIKQAKKWQKK